MEVGNHLVCSHRRKVLDGLGLFFNFYSSFTAVLAL